MSFVFYDTETTGTHTSFDQILQFAAIRTDWSLNIVDRFEVRCRLQPHIIPHPSALCVTGIEIGRLTDPQLPTHYTMVCGIREKLLSWSPSIFVGYNSLSFDEHLLRQAFYQCLHQPYLTNTRKNSRTDALSIVQAAAALAPGSLNIPRLPSGKAVFKLDQLAPANGFDHSNAHDAMADVEATIYLCKQVQENAPQVWSDALRFSQKAAVSDFIATEPVFILTETYFGNPYHFAVTRIGSDAENANVALALDVTVDVGALNDMNDALLARRLSQSPKIVRRIRVNASPMLTQVDPAGSFAGLTAQQLQLRAEAIQSDRALCARLTRVFTEIQAERAESEHVEEQLYSRFIGDADAERMEQFHQVDWSERLVIVDGFEDTRLKTLGRRLIFFEWPEALPFVDHTAISTGLARRMFGHGFDKAPWLTLPAAAEHIRTTLAGAGDRERAIVNGLQAYLAERTAFAESILRGRA